MAGPLPWWALGEALDAMSICFAAEEAPADRGACARGLWPVARMSRRDGNRLRDCRKPTQQSAVKVLP